MREERSTSGCNKRECVKRGLLSTSEERERSARIGELRENKNKSRLKAEEGEGFSFPFFPPLKKRGFTRFKAVGTTENERGR